MEMIRDCLNELYVKIDEMLSTAQLDVELGDETEFKSGYVQGLRDAWDLIYSTRAKFRE